MSLPIPVPDTLLFLDTETTGLIMDIHDVWEVAYALGDGPILTTLLPHSLATADPKALELNGYWNRTTQEPWPMSPFADLRLREAFAGKTIVGANPAFDAYRLQRRWGEAPWHYRLVDVQSMAVVVFDLDFPVGLHALAEKLEEDGWEIPQPDHTAAGDVATVRAVYKALRARRDGVARHQGEEDW